MLYYYWSRKGIRPSVFKDIPVGEMQIIRAFYEKELSEKRENAENGALVPQLL